MNCQHHHQLSRTVDFQVLSRDPAPMVRLFTCMIINMRSRSCNGYKAWMALGSVPEKKIFPQDISVARLGNMNYCSSESQNDRLHHNIIMSYDTGKGLIPSYFYEIRRSCFRLPCLPSKRKGNVRSMIHPLPSRCNNCLLNILLCHPLWRKMETWEWIPTASRLEGFHSNQ